ncbi:hypothetical protein XI00_38270 [Bradyrhizobium sp. CCBAU 21359]|nr:hypothetical protein [Bradyrhizobium sp. CCBAU 21359]
MRIGAAHWESADDQLHRGPLSAVGRMRTRFLFFIFMRAAASLCAANIVDTRLQGTHFAHRELRRDGDRAMRHEGPVQRANLVSQEHWKTPTIVAN